MVFQKNAIFQENKVLKRGRLRSLTAGMLVVIMLLGLTACGGTSSFKSDSQMVATSESAAVNGGFAGVYDEGFAYDMAEYEDDEDYAESPMEDVSVVDNSAYYNDRKLIRTVNMDVETKEFDQMFQLLQARVTALGGYIENMDTYNGSSYSYRSTRHANMTARIPKQQLGDFLQTVSDHGNVVSRSENVEDVTLTYVDMESRKEALQVEYERLMELLKKAEAMEDILIIEERLTSVRYQMESMESQLRTYDNKVDFATVYLHLAEVEELTPVKEESVWERIAGGFVDNVKDVGDRLADFFVWFIVSIPYFVMWAIFIAVIVLIVRLCIRGSKKKKEKKLAQMQAAYAQSMQVSGQVAQSQAPQDQPMQTMGQNQAPQSDGQSSVEQ